MVRKFLIILAIFVFCGCGLTKAQNILVHEIPYSTHHQDMWGVGEAFSLDFDYDLFNIAVQDGFNVGEITEVLGQQFGVMVDMGFYIFLRSTFSIHGFTLGTVDVDYPVRITWDFPDDYTFDHGETITINSSYDVLDGWALDTHFPTAGVIALDLEYGFGLHLDIIVCLFSCETIPIIPTINIPVVPYSTDPLPHDSIAIFYLNGQTGEVAYPCLDPVTGLPNICNDDILPIVIPDWFGIGLTGEIDIPYVVTEDSYNPNTQCLHAHGSDEWLWFNLDILEFLSFIAGFIPPPNGPAIQQAIGIINGQTIEYEIIAGVTATIEYFILHLDLHMSSHMTQDFAFCPTILATLRFPIDLPYSETDPSNGNAVVAEGVNDTITMIVNNDLHITYPCYEWDSMQVYDITYNIISTFSNHTWDSIAFDFILEAIFFQISIPTSFLPVAKMPEFCLPQIQANNADLGTYQYINACAPAITAPAASISSVFDESTETKGGSVSQTKDLTFCFPTNCEPLISEPFQLGSIPLTWFDQTWLLEGFVQDTVFPGTWLFPLPELDIEITAQDVICYGDSTGVITVEALHSTGPYTFEYSWGNVNTHLDPIDEINVPSGYYYVTLTDVYGCQVEGEINVADENPPILSSLYADDVLCHGEATGVLYSHVSGGVPPYTWNWQPSGRTEQNPSGVFAGWHYLTITDAVGCEHYDSVFVDEPDAPLTMDYISGNVSCYGYYDGYIDVTPEGGTPPYYYQWSNGQMTQDLINIPAGQYITTITDANGCTITETFDITQPDPLELTTYTQDVLCYGENTGSVDLVVTGGTPPYSYTWSNNSNNEDLLDLFYGIYIVTVVDANNCTEYTMVQIQQPALPLHGDITPTHVRCFGEGNGVADLNVFGGTPPYYFSWSTGAISEDIENLIPGIYSVTINDEHGCETADTVQIFQPDAPIVGTISGNDITCNGGNDGNIYITVQGGRPPYTFEWSNGSWEQNLINVQAGSYTVTVTDQSHCHYEMNIELTQPEPFYAQIMDDLTICYGESVEIGIGIIEGGTPPYTIVWSNGDQGMSTTVSPTETTTYTVQIVDAIFCESQTAEITVNVHKPLSLEVSASATKVCPGDIVDFEVIISGGGIDPNQVWVGDSLWNLPVSIAINQDTTIIFEVFDACKFNHITKPISISTYPLPLMNIAAEPTNGCSPLEVQFYENSPDVGQRYVWNFDDGDFENLSFDKYPKHTFYNARTFNVGLEITSTDGCKRDSTIGIVVFPNPEVEFRAHTTNVTMASPLIYFTNYTHGGFWHKWSFGDGNFSDDTNPSHTYSMPGTFHVTLVSESLYGCVDSAGVDIYVSNELAVYAPTAFTPNYDDLNETFKVIVDGIDEKTYSLIVYNRWGEIVHKSEGYEKEWNGRYGDMECPPDVYVWVVKFVDNYGNEHTYTGNVTLIR